MNLLAVIPARGGSKRVPRKNVREFGGRPMLGWPVAAALESGLFAHVLVSTEDDEIAAVASDLGAEVPFRRPGHLADDHTSTAAVMQHAVQWMQDHGTSHDAVCCIYATTPFLTDDDLRQSYAALTGGADYVLAVTYYDHPVQRALVSSPGGFLQPLDPAHAGTRTQDLPEAFHDAGQFCWGRASAFLDARPILSGATVPWMMPRWRAVDIDSEQDWQHAERIHATTRER